MKCALCNNEVVKLTGSVEFEVRTIEPGQSLGTISVPDLEYFECIACSDKLITTEQRDKAFEFIKQASLNGLFWWLGERTFTSSTPGIAKAVIDGRLLMRPYATFPHPNVLA